MKYGIWNVSKPGMEAVNALAQGGYAPLTAMVLASRGLETKAQADAYLGCNASLIDPYRMTDMDLAAARVALAMTRGEKVAVFGDSENDLSMIEAVPNAVAVSNASDQIKAASRWHIGASADDAVADALFDIADAAKTGAMPAFMRG